MSTGNPIDYISAVSIDTSAKLSTIVTDETGTGALVFANTPTLITPLLGTPTSGVLTTCTGYPVASLVNLGAGIATALTTPSSANLAAAITDETGTGALVFATGPTFSGIKFTVVTLTSANSPYTVLSTDIILLCNCTGGAITLNLPASSSSTNRVIWAKKTDSSANAMTLDGNAAETIDGAATQATTVQYFGYTIACDGSNWSII